MAESYDMADQCVPDGCGSIHGPWMQGLRQLYAEVLDIETSFVDEEVRDRRVHEVLVRTERSCPDEGFATRMAAVLWKHPGAYSPEFRGTACHDAFVESFRLALTNGWRVGNPWPHCITGSRARHLELSLAERSRAMALFMATTERFEDEKAVLDGVDAEFLADVNAGGPVTMSRIVAATTDREGWSVWPRDVTVLGAAARATEVKELLEVAKTGPAGLVSARGRALVVAVMRAIVEVTLSVTPTTATASYRSGVLDPQDAEMVHVWFQGVFEPMYRALGPLLSEPKPPVDAGDVTCILEGLKELAGLLIAYVPEPERGPLFEGVMDVASTSRPPFAFFEDGEDVPGVPSALLRDPWFQQRMVDGIRAGKEEQVLVMLGAFDSLEHGRDAVVFLGVLVPDDAARLAAAVDSLSVDEDNSIGNALRALASSASSPIPGTPEGSKGSKPNGRKRQLSRDGGEEGSPSCRVRVSSE